MTGHAKWIRCTVADRGRFGKAQLNWAELGEVDGFVWQCGGWSGNEAQIVALWRDSVAYRSFMDHEHDRLAGDQASTYSTIHSSSGPVVSHSGEPIRLDRAGPGAILQIIHCVVRPGHVDQFLETQKATLAPGMASVPGLLGGIVVLLDQHTYLAMSLWSSASAHRVYVDGSVAELQRRALHQDDLARLSLHLIDLESAWSVF